MSAAPLDAYKQSVPAVGLSLERATPGVPDDGYFYVLLKGELNEYVWRYNHRNGARALFEALLLRAATPRA